MIKNIHDMTNQELRQELRTIANDYRFYPSEITKEIDAQFKAKAKPLIELLNQRSEEMWLENGGTLVAKSPTKVSFNSITTKGI